MADQIEYPEIQPETQTDATPPGPTRRGLKRSIFLILAIIAGIIVYAYGFSVTKVNLDEIGSPDRQSQLVRVLRSLARPEIFTYERTNTPTDHDFFMP